MRGITARAPRGARRLALAVGLLLASAPAAQAASVAVAPATGVAGTGLQVTGSGWNPGDPIDVDIDGQLVCELTADGTGSISGNQSGNGCQVPSAPPAGTHGLIATDLNDGTQAAGNPFVIPVAASFTAPSTVAAGAPATLTSTATAANGSPSSYFWEFGDGQQSAGPATITHAYSAPGTYTVTLIVSDATGDVAETAQQIQVVSPVAAFNPTEATVLAGSSVSFDGTQSSDPDGITSYSWSFGDGGTSTSAQPSHRYLETGTFTVTLRVVDGFGNTAQVSHQITVIAPPPVQTLIMTPVAAPAVVKSAAVIVSQAGLVDLGERAFCPGEGPHCTVSVLATTRTPARGAAARARHRRRSRVKAGSRSITIAPNASAEMTFRLTKQALASLTTHLRLPVRIKLVVARGDQTMTDTLVVTLRPHTATG